MTTLPPLHIHLLAHPKSESAKAVAQRLMGRFVEPPASGGLRIPVFFTPERGNDLPPGIGERDGIDVDRAQHTLIVILADARMARVVEGGTGVAWRDFIRDAITVAPLGSSVHHVLPIALELGAFGLADQAHFLGVPLDSELPAQEAQERRLAEISLHIAARGIQLLEFGKIDALAPDRIKAPVHLFISHAKADLKQDRTDPAHQVLNELTTLPIQGWFDAGQIAPGQEFERAIKAGLEDCTIMLAFCTDAYGSRPWCRREVLDAKRMGAHVLLVDALNEGEPRRFPYLGNMPTIRWQFRDPTVDARRVVDRAVLEALRFKHNRAQLQTMAVGSEVVLAAPPEAVTLAYELDDPATEKTFIYPDPPLGREEIDVLVKLRPKARFLTPLGKFALTDLSGKSLKIAVAVSNSNDPERYGLSPAHQQTLSDEIHLYLLAAGLQVAYGGALRGDFSQASNFTLRLFELVRGYAKLAQGNGFGVHPIENQPPWPLYLEYGDAEWNLFGNEAICKKGPRPELPWSDEQIFPPTREGWRLRPTKPEQRYAWARGLSAMRKQITEDTQARLVIGGDLRNFQGVVPGVVEEAWISLSLKRPLYLVGAFGGAARAVSDQLMGLHRPEFSDGDAREHVPHYQEAIDCYTQYGGDFVSMQRMGADITQLRAVGLAGALNNGLSNVENEELVRSTEPTRIAQLVLTGLSRMVTEPN
jgi:hypothetical protein